MPSDTLSPASGSENFARYVRVAGSAAGAISRSFAAYFLFGSDHSVTDAVPSFARPQSLGDRDHGFLLGEPRDADRGLPGRDDLSGIDQGGGDDAAGIGDQRGVGQRVLGQVNGAFGAVKPRTGFVGGSPRLVHLRVGGPAFYAQVLGAGLGGGGLRQHAGGGGKFGLGLFGLQFQIDFIKRGQGLADIDGLADLDQALCDLAGYPKADVGFNSRLDGADKAALGDSAS